MEDLKILKLKAHDPQDLKILSACLQDSLVPLKEIQYDRPQNRFTLLLNRYRWEDQNNQDKGSRIHSALSFEGVTKAEYTGFNLQASRPQNLSLLTLQYHAPYIHLSFADKASIRLEVKELKAKLRDAHVPWPAKVPSHSV